MNCGRPGEGAKILIALSIQTAGYIKNFDNGKGNPGSRGCRIRPDWDRQPREHMVIMEKELK